MSIFTNIFGDKDFVDVNSKIESLMKSIPRVENISSPEDSTSSIISSMIENESGSKNDTSTELSQLFQNIVVPNERLARYSLYDEIYKSIPIIRRIIKVYIANILSKNPVDGKCILFRELDEDSDDKKETTTKAKQFCEEVIDNYDIINKLKTTILPRELLYGDCFVEVVDVQEESDKIDLNKISVLSENDISLLNEEINRAKNNKIGINYILSKISDLFFEIGTSSSILLTESSNNLGTSDKDVIIKIHKPHNIIVLDTEYGTRLGYLEVKNDDSIVHKSIGQSLANTIGRITSLSGNEKGESNQEQIINKLIFFALKRVIVSSQKNNTSINSNDVDTIVKSLGEDVYKFVKKMFVEQGTMLKLNKIKVRFIPSNRMVQWSNSSLDYGSYGESIVEGLILPAKLYMLNQLANTISKLSRASIIRKWKLEVGSSQMHNSMIQKLKRELYNTRVTLNDLSSFKSIPKLLSDFKDMFILTKGGQSQVDVDVQSMGDPSIKVADLEDARREIISLSGVPAPYLGYMDVVELKEQLVHTNVSFATEITDMQESDSASLRKIIDIIAEIKGLEYKPSDYINTTLIPPVVLILQLIEMTLSSVSNIASVFVNMNIQIDPYFFLKQYVPHIDWEKFKNASQKFESKTKTLENITNAASGSGGNSSGGSGGLF